MPSWPFRSPSSPLDDVTDSTPHRFRIWLNEADASEAMVVLTGPPSVDGELTVSPAGARDDRGTSVDIASTFSPRTAAILRPLNALDRAGVTVIGFEALDLVTEVDERTLAAAVAAWDANANRGPHRHRLEVLAGLPLLERCLEHLARADDRGPNGRPAWRFATTCVAFNTAGSEGPMLEAALGSNRIEDSAFLGPVIDRAQVARLTGSPFSLPDEPLATLIRRRAYVSERAATLAWYLPAPLAASVTDALCDAGTRGGEAAEPALMALARAAPTERIRGALDRVLASDDAGAQATALGTLATHWPDDARPIWRRFLQSRSIPLRWAAESAMGLHGTEEDVPEAAAHLAKVIRAKSSTHMTPPRGADIIALLMRHGGHPDARAGLADVSARWDRLADDMREWLERHHPELRPGAGDVGDAAEPVELEAEAEEPGTWPGPTVERDGDAFLVSFDEGAAHSPARERFEELAVATPGIDVLDGDREWLRLSVASADPAKAVRELWDRAGSAG